MPDPVSPDPVPDTPPPAAEAVALGEGREEDAGRQVAAEEELTKRDRLLREREVRISELEDENGRLRAAQSAPPRRAPSTSRDWFAEL